MKKRLSQGLELTYKKRDGTCVASRNTDLSLNLQKKKGGKNGQVRWPLS